MGKTITHIVGAGVGLMAILAGIIVLSAMDYPPVIGALIIVSGALAFTTELGRVVSRLRGPYGSGPSENKSARRCA